MNKWLELAAKCEAATGPDREIDRAIIAALGYSWRGLAYWDNETSERTLEGSVFYTHSLDAITALIERDLPGWQWNLCMRRTSNGGPIAWVAPNNGLSSTVEASTPALALCAAFCRAMAAKSPEETPETASTDCK